MQPTVSQPAFALAKIQPPRLRAGLVERPALERSLDAALLHHRLTVLIAPAGYGKTAALTRQIRQLPAGCALAWVSVDEDDQLQRFLACLTTALEPHDLPWRVAPDALGTLALAERGLRDVAVELVNALAAAEAPRGLIVIDDAHRITDPLVFELLQAMLERLPEQWSVAVASRVEPPLSLARWRALGELAEFRLYDLRFDAAEAAALLAGSGVVLTPAAMHELLRRTEGWAAGLRLSLSARHNGAAHAAGMSTQRHLFDYLASEVLDDMPAELRAFLLRCSVLPELTAARCAHVSRIPQTARLLEEVERRGLFVATLDADELTLRLHDLFRDFLEDRLQREHPQELPHLLRRAADDETDPVRAVGYLTRAAAWDEAARVIIERGPALISAGGGPAVEQMLAQFPAAEFEHRPDLHLLHGLTKFPRFDFDAMLASMRSATQGYQRDGRAQEAALAQAYACVALMNTGGLAEATRELDSLRTLALDDAVRSMVCFGNAWAAYANTDAEAVAPMVAQMLDALERSDDPQVWDCCFFVSLLTGLPGMRPLLERFARGAIRQAHGTPTQLRVGVMHIRAWLAFSDGDVDVAAAWLARADDDCRWLGRPRSLMTENWMCHTLVDAVRGDRAASYGAAQDNKRDLEENSLLSNRRSHEYEELFTYLRAAWLFDDAPLIRALDAQLAHSANAYEWAAAPDDRRFSQACLALLEGRLPAARELLLPLAAGIERSCFFPAVQALCLLADIELQLGKLQAAADLLRPWCAAALAGGDVGGALLAGPRVLQRLAAAPWGTHLGAAEQGLLQRLAGAVAGRHADAAVLPSARVVPGGTAPEPATSTLPARHSVAPTPVPWQATGPIASLSEREREVLARIAAGDSNKLIARAFSLSPHTVKRHVANILAKLGVETRGQAAARYRSSATESSAGA